jgi:hypothetical protein
MTDHEPSATPEACDAVIVPALEVEVCPAKTTAALVLTENAPVEMVAADPATVMPSEELAAPCDVDAEAPTMAAVTPLSELTVPTAVVAETAVTAMETDCVVMPLLDVPVRPASASAIDAATMPTAEVAAADETLAVMPAEIDPADAESDHDPSEFAEACDEVIIPALEVAVCPAKAIVALELAENAPVELVAAEPASAMTIAGLTAPVAVAADVPANAAGMPFDDVTAPAEVVADDAATATDTD